MRNFTGFIVSRLITGVLVVAPIYLAVLLLLKATKSLLSIVQPVAALLPEWMPAAQILSLLMILFFCFFIGLGMKTPKGRTIWEQMENSLFQRLPGYALFRSLTQQLSGKTEDKTWKPALAEIEDALVPAFIIEELETGASPFSSLPYRRPWLGRSTSLHRIVCIRWMFLLLRRLRPSPGGDRDRRIFLLP